MYNPTVTVTFFRNGFVPFAVESTLERVLFDNPGLKSVQDRLERALKSARSVAIDQGIIVSVVE